eukprot:scaffold57501_cov50-Phaeocystis_antarctica.AAC.6
MVSAERSHSGVSARASDLGEEDGAKRAAPAGEGVAVRRRRRRRRRWRAWRSDAWWRGPPRPRCRWWPCQRRRNLPSSQSAEAVPRSRPRSHLPRSHVQRSALSRSALPRSALLRFSLPRSRLARRCREVEQGRLPR